MYMHNYMHIHIHSTNYNNMHTRVALAALAVVGFSTSAKDYTDETANSTCLQVVQFTKPGCAIY